MVKSVISIKNLTKTFSDFKINNLNLDINKGDFFGFLGPNGAGKTTIVKLLTGQIKPTSGTISVLGIDVEKNPIKVKENIGIIPEQENPPSFMTAKEYLYFVSKVRKISSIEQKIEEWMTLLNFKDQQDVLCKDLSRGTKQKLIVAQAFIHEPELVFIDEPLINLDPIIQRKIKDYLKKYTQKGNSVFLSTHVLDIAGELCTSIGIIKNGKVLIADKISKIVRPKENLEKAFARIIKK